MSRRNNSAFTIIELLVTIVIIGILATISIVSYRGITQRASEAILKSELSSILKLIYIEQASSGDYPTSLDSIKDLHLTSKNKYSYKPNNTADPKTFCLTGRFNNSLFSASEESGIVKGACLTNFIDNSNFSNGTTDWYSIHSSSTITNGNTFTNTADGSLYYAEIRQLTGTAIVSHKYYGRAKIRVTNSAAASINCMTDASTNQNFFVISNPIANTWYEMSGVITANAYPDPYPYSNIKFIQVYEDNATANGKTMEVQNVVAIDLTEIFGAGNEPTSAQMDSILSQFPNSWIKETKLSNL